MLKGALVQRFADSFYTQGMVTIAVPVDAEDILKECVGFLEDGLIFDDDIIAGFGVRDHQLYILRHQCYLSQDPKKAIAYPKDAVDACHRPIHLV